MLLVEGTQLLLLMETDRLDLYVENPDVCNLLIIKENNKLSARALLWRTDRGFYKEPSKENNDISSVVDEF